MTKLDKIKENLANLRNGIFPSVDSVNEVIDDSLKLLDEHREEMEATNENYSKVENRMADLLCYAMKYETKENADVVEGVARRYLMSYLKAMVNNTLGTDCLPQPPKGDR